jgi:hypothetical protein
MQVFTSVAVNYLPKARVLATSLKRFHPEAKFHLVISDAIPEELARDPGPFDRVLHVEDLPIENVRNWIFQHTLVELCTAVKGVAARKIMDENPGEPVFYFDPDIVILGPLTGLVEQLARNDVLLTPHQLDPDGDPLAVADNEMCSLQHGVYNLGFLGLAASAEGRRFADWWADRLRWFCWAEADRGLFTDQRWADLAPAFFPTLGIVRDPGCNVATWNLTRRTVTGSLAEGFCVNGQPLTFFHFSGFDSGAQKRMLDKFGRNSPALYELREWYVGECRRMGQDALGNAPWAYGSFDNGKPITAHHRRYYRSRLDVQQKYPDPTSTADPKTSYYHWYQEEVGIPLPDTMRDLEQELLRSRREVLVLGQANRLLTETNQNLIADNERIIASHDAFGAANASLSETIKTLNAENHTLAAANNAYSLTNASLNAANQALIHANISHVQSNSTLTQANNQLQEEVKAARHEIDQARKLLDSARYQLDLTRDQLEIARNELNMVYRSKGYRAVRTVSHLIRGQWPHSA